MEAQNEVKPVVIFAGELFEATYIKDMLEQNGIPAFFENELMSSIAPWNLAPGGANTLKVMVSSVDYEQSIQLLDSLEQSKAEEEAD